MSVATKPRAGVPTPSQVPGAVAPGRQRRLRSRVMSRAGRRSRSNAAGVDRVGRIRASIAAGCYLTPEKIDVAVDRLLADLLSWD